MKKIVLIAFLVAVMLSLWGQKNIDDLLFGSEGSKDTKPKEEKVPKPVQDDLIKVHFQKKTARLAMIMSAALPGAGQFYADKSSISTWIFPAIEVALIGGAVLFNINGNKKTDEFEKYATGESITREFKYTINDVEYSYTYTGPRYNRLFQAHTENVLINFYESDIYDRSFFRLDSSNTQHFYEDIGKYNKYLFGWADWYHNFAFNPLSNDFALDQDDFADVWIWADTQYDHTRRWSANVKIEDFLNGDTDQHIAPGTPLASLMRQEYIQMRKDANAQYAYARYFILGIAFNHLASAVDAVLLTNKVNKTYITQNNFKFDVYASMKDGRLQPNLGLSLAF